MKTTITITIGDINLNIPIKISSSDQGVLGVKLNQPNYCCVTVLDVYSGHKRCGFKTLTQLLEEIRIDLISFITESKPTSTFRDMIE